MKPAIRELFDRLELPRPSLSAALASVPPGLEAKLEARGQHVVSTEPLPAPLYQIDSYLSIALEPDAEDFLFLGYDGYGRNAWYLSFYLKTGSFAVFLQLPWASVYEDEADLRVAVNEQFAAVEQLVATSSVSSLVVVQSPITESRYATFPDGHELIDWTIDEDALQTALRLSRSREQTGVKLQV